jgi:hypothetical protein
VTINPTVDRVVDLLEAAGFQRLAMPLEVSGIPFQFAAGLVGTERSADLIVVVDTVEDRDLAVVQKVHALSRAMDLVKSRRPLTAVLAGPRPDALALDALSQSCRVLAIDPQPGPYEARRVEDAIAILLPLRLPEPTDTLADPLGELQMRLPQASAVFLTTLLTAAQHGPDAVTKAVCNTLAAPFAEWSEESAEP